MLFEVMETADALCYPLYLARGRRPWFPGYYTAKRRQIEIAIDAGLLRPGTVLPSGFGFRIEDKILEPDFAAAARGLVCMRLSA